ncbi:hypothetical protein FB440_10298 [Vibrio crassostreae]|nr:hypothetical protein FB440_10298 [Vibrio crassostreae]CAK1726753.1 hypothetical protein VCRA2119O145_120031 [Vibrio crassostreae]CAK1938768.1 hypothetical protein VCRA2118O144_260081 [Vibrio crassostreae]CAK2325274.1 hypothetical protein VCRA2117O143_270030 [Vibrio crassostreae]CAK2332314.1 hypothetical protein VCRA2117O142_290031 [Vibrio crassostreae]
MKNEVMAYLGALIIALIAGGVSNLGAIAALKTDINCIKRVQQDQKSNGYENWRYLMKGHKCKDR